MQKLIELIGAGDGQGNTSSMRVIMLLIVASVIVPKIVLAIQTKTPAVWTEGDMAMLGVAITGKIVQNQQENVPPAPPKV